MMRSFSLLGRRRKGRHTSRRSPAKDKRRAARPVLRVEELEPRILLANGVYLTPGQPGQEVAVQFRWISRDASYRNELDLSVVDDVQGHIGGLKPGDRAYTAAALSGARHHVVFGHNQGPGATKTLLLPGGSFFTLSLIQNATSRQVLHRNPANHPGHGPVALFSISKANPDHARHVRSLPGFRFACEDSVDGDRDFNDLIAGLSFGQLFPRSHQPLRSVRPPVVGPPGDTTPPLLMARLAHDTGTSPGDGITSDPTVTGTATDAGGISRFRAGFDRMAPGGFRDVLADLHADGSFLLDRSRLEQILGGPLADGPHTLHLQAADQAGNVSGVLDVAFTLDTTPPSLSLDLDQFFDSAPVGDQQTTAAHVALLGRTEPNTTVTLQETGATTTADAAGRFAFLGVTLAPGANPFTVRTAADAAGNVGSFQRSITLLAPCDFDDTLSGWTTGEMGGSAS